MADRHEQPPKEEPPSLARAWDLRFLGAAALIVALAATGYFFYLHQYRPNHLSRFEAGAANQPGLLSTLRHLADLDRNPYHFYAGNLDWIALATAAGAALVLIAIGYLALGALDLYIPKLARLALAYVVGLGVVGVVLEVETIFGIHTRETIVATVGFLFVILTGLVLYRTSRIVKGGPFADWGRCRSEIAREYSKRYGETLCQPTGPLALAVYTLLVVLIAVVTLLTFYHGSFTPVTYWDSLILYVGYARDIFFLQAFPFKAVAQVGIGLGANYPHLYALMTAATATVAGRWSDSFAQVAPPLAGLLSCFLIYYTALRLTRHHLLALALTAVFRTVPYGIAYFVYASDYSFVMLFVAAFLYVALLYLETTLAGYFVLATLIAAFAMHINYLMGVLWIVWAVMLILAHGRPVREPEAEPLEVLEESDLPRDMVDLQTKHPKPPALGRFLRSGRFWGWVVVAVVVASPWYVRNWVLTGNPVYAFFQPLFPKTENYNQEVMDSARVEWTLNGDGIGAASLTREFWEQFDLFRQARDVSNVEIARIETPLARKIAASWRFWVTDFNAWKLAPSFVGIALPGFLIFLMLSRGPRRLDLTDRETVARRRFGWLCTLLLLLLLAYHYLLADLYLYQIIPLVVLIPLFGAYFVRALGGRFERGLFVALALWIAIFPGLAMALMGFKLKSQVDLGGRRYLPFELVALHQVGLDQATFHQLAFGNDADAWVALNTYCLDEKVLTHENRHLVLDRRVEIVHFDDWEVQALWGRSPDEQLRGLHDLGVKFYLFIPNETKHQVNRRLGPPAKSDISTGEPWEFSALRG
ncbi:MAG: hypothetical protein AMJ72_12390, partial [Acidithiobacillales bacterium SM1_46]